MGGIWGKRVVMSVVASSKVREKHTDMQARERRERGTERGIRTCKRERGGKEGGEERRRG